MFAVPANTRGMTQEEKKANAARHMDCARAHSRKFEIVDSGRNEEPKFGTVGGVQHYLMTQLDIKNRLEALLCVTKAY